MSRRYECFRCGGLFRLGEHFRSDAPGVVYHLRCYVAAVKSRNGS